MKKISMLICFLLAGYFIQAQEIKELAKGPKSSFRGMDSYKDRVVWVSGSSGWIGLSKNSGDTWEWFQPKGYEKFDFRDIVAFSAKEALAVSSGSPAVIIKTKDAGKTWTEVYRNDDADIFLDAVDFSGKQGYILGDPMDGKFQLLKSTNKGNTWQDVSEEIILLADEGEAAFAASGSSIQIIGNWLYIGTGGRVSSLMKRNKKESKLDVVDVPIWTGQAGTGIFSIDFLNQREGVVVGGNYMDDKNNSNNVLLTKNGGLSWVKPELPVGGYRSCVKYISPTMLVATGTSGTDISIDGGNTWKTISSASYNVISLSKKGKRVLLANSSGGIGYFDIP